MGDGMALHSSSAAGIDAASLAAILAASPPANRDYAQFVDRALAALADAEARLANLQARVNYLEGLSVTDELTGLFNRRGFANQLGRALASARRGGPHGALLICDLDGFKSINDRYGHAAGDEVLRQVGGLLSLHVRRSDAAARLGGDEFALLLVGASERGASEKAAGFRRLIGGSRFVHDCVEMTVAASIGCAFYIGDESEEELFRRADAAMYADKRVRRSERRARPRLAVA
jgi:diguanylate cyclase (GGDEF)-like protein